MFVIGTAGHVDHGKTSIIKALTGIDTDRLPEEKMRGLTIDLGFAHFPGKGGSPIGVVDVPGHERFIRNMVAGAWALDCALLVVAADDGWMQQSEDHLRVLRFMDVPRVILVISKIDLTVSGQVEEVRSEGLRRCSRQGYRRAASIAVSARSGQDIDLLRKLIIHTLEEVRPEESGFPLVYIDRVFLMKGAGVVVTGTLKGASLEQGQDLIALPGERRIRIRGIQSYHRAEKRVDPVSRVALNLHGVKRGDLKRGDCLTPFPQNLAWDREFVVRLSPPGDLEKSGRRQGRPRNHSEVEIALGTGHRIARIHYLAGGNLARIVCSSPLAYRWNQPVVFIQQGGSAILAGGRIVWTGPTVAGKRQLLEKHLRKLPQELRSEHLVGLKLGMNGMVRVGQGAFRSAAGEVRLGSWAFRREKLTALEERIEKLAQSPGGISMAELRSGLNIDSEPLEEICRTLCQRGSLVSRESRLRTANPLQAALSPLARSLLADLEKAEDAGLQIKSLKIAGATKELRTLARSGRIVSLDGNIYYSTATYRRLSGLILGGLAPGDRIGIPEAKERASLSRKYAIPLLNRMEQDGYVKRDGDVRVVLRRAGSAFP
jgi:selenocysteine-specific elongation factor